MREQTKEAIRQMREAGFARNEFWVEITRIYRAAYARDGVRNPYDYGRANIYVKNIAQIGERVDALLAVGLGVHKSILRNGLVVWAVTTEYSKRGKLEVIDYNDWPEVR